MGVEKGIEKVSKVMMPLLVILMFFVVGYTLFTMEGAWDGVIYYLKPDFSKLSPMTFVAAMGQLFYSMSLAMGIMITFGSYMKKEISIEKSAKQIELFDSIVDKGLLVRRLNLVACRILPEDEAKNIKRAEQISIFDDLSPESNDGDETELLRERKMQSAIIGIKKKFGKNAIIKGMDLEDGATAVDRNSQIGGHKA